MDWIVLNLNVSSCSHFENHITNVWDLLLPVTVVDVCIVPILWLNTQCYPFDFTVYAISLISLYIPNLCALHILKICEAQVLEGGAHNLAMLTNHQNSKYGELTRNIRENQLGGVIFGCKHDTIEECFRKQLFGPLNAPFTSSTMPYWCC